MYVRKMEKLAKYIEALPEGKVYMAMWFTKGSDSQRYTLFCEEDVKNVCGTSACIAGWQVLLNGLCLGVDQRARDNKGQEVGDPQFIAQKSLGLTDEQAVKLFFRDRWPDKFQKIYPYTNADVAARIRHMIQTGE